MKRRDLLKLGASIATVPAAGLSQQHEHSTATDHILAAAGEDEKTRFREGLWWIDGHAMRKYGKPFTGCTTAEQTAILQTLDEGKDPDTAPGHQFFPWLKGAAQVYYSTEIGFQELNKGERVPTTFACPHPEHP